MSKEVAYLKVKLPFKLIFIMLQMHINNESKHKFYFKEGTE